jgi:hypothetical protein
MAKPSGKPTRQAKSAASQAAAHAAAGEEVALLRQRALQFLVHSFLYYRLSEPVISDAQFDVIAAELRSLRKVHPRAELPHGDLVDQALGPEESGFLIRDYPAPVISAAFKLLYATADPEVGFVEFVERRGYRAHLGAEAPGPA